MPRLTGLAARCSDNTIVGRPRAPLGAEYLETVGDRCELFFAVSQAGLLACNGSRAVETAAGCWYGLFATSETDRNGMASRRNPAGCFQCGRRRGSVLRALRLGGARPGFLLWSAAHLL